jgi:hypothetical protein
MYIGMKIFVDSKTIFGWKMAFLLRNSVMILFAAHENTSMYFVSKLPILHTPMFLENFLKSE